MNHGLYVGVWIIFAGILALSSCSSPEETEVVIPEITSLSETVLSVGDTLTIQGNRFASPEYNNRVVFNNALASVAPIVATGTMLSVIVPANANAGPLYVTSKGVKSNSIDVKIERDVGDVWTMGGGSNYHLEVPVSSDSVRYLVVAHSATSSGVPFAFKVTPDNSSIAAAPQRPVTASPSGAEDLAMRFKSAIRDEALDYLRTHGVGRQGVPDRAPALAPPGAPPAEQNFLVLKCADCSVLDPNNFETVTATLRYDGTHTLVYSDLNQPTGSFTQSDYEAFGARFNSEIYPTDTQFFGQPTDIDNNEKIIILFTPRVNALTPLGVPWYISGFVLINDLSPGVFPAGTSNGGEIFYSMVPDPNGEYGKAFPKSLVTDVVPGTLAHEFEHMISNGYRYVVLGGGTNPLYIQQTWLEEGMAHMAEDLNGMDTQNILRSNKYLSGPRSTSLLGNAELRPYHIDTIEQRGGIFLFLRYLGDQFGEEIFKTIVQSRAVGIASIENVTRTDFYASIGDFLATLYLSGREITDDPTYRYTSLDLQRDFGDLLVTGQTAGGGGFGESVRSATGDFYLLTDARPPALLLGVSSAANADVRVVIVRTE